MSPEYLRQLVNLKEIPYKTRSIVPLDQPKIRTKQFSKSPGPKLLKTRKPWL